MPSEQERTLVRELAERGVSVRFPAQLAFKSADELAPVETALLEALRPGPEVIWVRPGRPRQTLPQGLFVRQGEGPDRPGGEGWT